MAEDELEKIKSHTHLKLIKKEGKNRTSKTFFYVLIKESDRTIMGRLGGMELAPETIISMIS